MYDWWTSAGDPIFKSQFKNLTIIKRFDNWYKCKCVCGTVKKLHRLYLYNHPNPSCGCMSKGQVAKDTNLDKVLKKKHKFYLLTKQQLLDVLNSNCVVCGAEPNAYREEHLNGMMPFSYVYRKNINLGFIPSNVEPRCGKCRSSKPS